MRERAQAIARALAAIGIVGLGVAQSQQFQTRPPTPSRLVDPIDEHALVRLKGNVRKDLAKAHDLGLVDDGKPLHLYLLLQRSTAQQADLDNLLERQQQPTAPEYHNWLTPKEFGARFGASPEDMAKIKTWLESHGFKIRSVLNNASMIDFAATAGQVREAFHTELHYFNIRGGKHVANVEDPQIPAALAPVVAGIKGLARIPARTNHTPIRQASYDAHTHRWHNIVTAGNAAANPAFNNSSTGDLDVTPQDLYTIYDVHPVFTGGNLAATATVAVIEESDIEYGTVNGSGVATGGDVATFRTLFGVPGTLNMHVYHGYGTVTCTAPGIDPDGIGEDGEASLDAEWINATAPSANLIFMSCDQDPDQGIDTSMPALIDNNLSDVMSLSYGNSELNTTTSDYTFQDTLYAQAATQGQSFFVSSGDSGSDVYDQNTNGTATSGINVSAFGSPLTTVAGGTDFSDLFDDSQGGPAQSTYWSSTNSMYYGDALSYVPETAWNQSCASSIFAVYEGFSGVGLCVDSGSSSDGSVVGGSGGISTHYAVPAWQTGISGYSNSMHAQPDIAGFASDTFWGHALISCDSNPPDASVSGCTSEDNFGEAGGTSFVAPYMAGVAGLLVSATGSRQGLLNPALYALGKAQYTAKATETACYSNGQTSNTGVTTGLPAAGCIFNDVTTSNNDVPCAMASTGCFVPTGDTYGMLSLNGASSLAVAYPSTIGFDQVTGIGTVNVNNLITKWNTAFTSTTGLMASLTTLTSSQSTELTATVTGGTPPGYVDTPPALTGTASFQAGATSLGNCTLVAGTCMLSVPGSALQPGANSVTVTFKGSGTYPASTSSIITITITTSGEITPTVTVTPSVSSITTIQAITVTAAVSGGNGNATPTGSVTLTSGSYTSAAVTLSGGSANINVPAGSLATGTDSLRVSYTPDSASSSTYTTALGVNSITVTKATPTIDWPDPAAITYGTVLSALQLDATAKVGETAIAGNFVYNPAAGTVLKAGSHSLSVTFTPTESAVYSNAATSSSLLVNRAIPVITWVTPKAIHYGVLLGTAQLDASSKTAGEFTYTPKAGTMLPVGAHKLSAAFAPTDSADYAAGAGSVTLTVEKATQTITFKALPESVRYGVSPQTLSASASSHLAVTFSVTGPGKVSGDKLTITGVGTVVVSSKQSGNADYDAAVTISQSIKVGKATPAIKLTASASTVLQGKPVTFTAALSGNGAKPTGTVTFLNRTTVIGSTTLNSGGVATCATTKLAVGKHSITASYNGNGDYEGATSTAVIVTVSAP